MLKSSFVAVLVLCVGLPAYSQDIGPSVAVTPSPDDPTPGQPLNKDHLAPTGKTLPHPGVPQASGPTELDRSIQKQDDRTDNSICKGC
jgi:hypothetical protein